MSTKSKNKKKGNTVSNYKKKAVIRHKERGTDPDDLIDYYGSSRYFCCLPVLNWSP